MDQRCATAHAKLLAGTCPWCGQPVFNGHVISDPRTPSSIDSFFANFADTQIDFAEYKDGLTLKQVVEREGPLDWQRAARYIAEVARQLGEIHRAQQIHGNVRPANIYLGDENSVELGEIAQDFRYASIDEESIPGIVDCLAPEQAVNSTEVDCRADIYSLGCTFYFLLTGHAPFDEGSIAERLLKHQVETPAAI